jgi:hypothetical protein
MAVTPLTSRTRGVAATLSLGASSVAAVPCRYAHSLRPRDAGHSLRPRDAGLSPAAGTSCERSDC